MVTMGEEHESSGATATSQQGPKPFFHIPLTSKDNSAPSAWRLTGRYQTAPSCMESTTVIHIPANALAEGPKPD